ncbi:MAG TPA: hypothetical protein VFL85_01570 [Candidatus Saccharimonadales bacterium]|nr:hypothetical protein [Candidatus Saccharimonadales bacterium]
MNLNVKNFDDDTATLCIRQGKWLYTVGTDLDFSNETATERSLIRLDGMMKTAKRNVLVQILEKTPEEASLVV